MSRPDLQIFGFCFLFFTSYLFVSFRAGVRGCVLGCGEERSLYIYAFSIISAFFFPLCSGPLRRLRRHLPRTRGRLPSQALRASSPGGRAKCTPVSKGKLCGKTKFFQLCLTTNFAKTDAGTLASPCGGGGTAPCAVTERGGSHARGKVKT